MESESGTCKHARVRLREGKLHRTLSSELHQRETVREADVRYAINFTYSGNPEARQRAGVSPCMSAVQSCFSKPSRATRLKARAATVLSRRGAMRPQEHREQHQPVKRSSSTQIKRLFMLPLAAYVGLELAGDRRNTQRKRARKVNSCPSLWVISHESASKPSN